MTDKITYLTVSALNRYLEKKFSNDPYLREVYIKGEISNCKLHTNGTLYFAIKDDNTKINAQKFNARGFSDLKDGDTVLIKADLNFYFPHGTHRLIVSEMKKDSVGDLYQRFIELRDKLQKEGLFSVEYKKTIKRFNKNIAIITASTGAAIQDIKRTIIRRYPIANVNVYSSLVQGEQAINDIIKNLKLADNDDNDVIILARGGGAIEDLWSFNSEEVVRAIFSCKTPVITGVGHETDTTLADFVADVRASTPTAAAELATATSVEDLKNYLLSASTTLQKAIENKINNNKKLISEIENSYYIKNYTDRYAIYKNQLTNLEKSLQLYLNTNLKERKIRVNNDFERFKSIDLLREHKKKFEFAIENLEANSPLNIIKKGYAVLQAADKSKVSSINDVKKDDKLQITLNDGTVYTQVLEVSEERI